MKGTYSKQVTETFGGWLSGLAPWMWFCTLTFSQPVNPSTARYWFDKYLQKIEDAVNSPSVDSANTFGRRKEIRAFRGDELSPQRGRLHIHSLIADVEGLSIFCGVKLPPTKWGRRCCWTHAWPCGYARILPYDPKRGASYYVSKYVANPIGDWELYGFHADKVPTTDNSDNCIAYTSQDSSRSKRHTQLKVRHSNIKQQI